MAHARAPRSTAKVARVKRERRVPWIALGLLLVFGAGLGFAAWSRATSSRSPALIAARDIAAGETVTVDGVGTADVGAGPGARTVPASDVDLVVGGVARGPIPAGTVLSPDMIGDGDAVPDGQAVIGAVLEAGAYPTASIRPGDPVRMVEAAATGKDPTAVPSELGAARIWAVTTPDGPGGSGLFVSLLVPEDQAAAASNAAARQQLRLILIGGAG
jgi:SAF domain